jgi:hypothetical protein
MGSLTFLKIADFIVDRMSSYLNGGMRPETAARFARGELGAIYKGNHYSRDDSGAMRPTLPPENIPIEAARAKCDEAIKEILDYCASNVKKAPENTPLTQKKNSISDFEKMAGYARNPA